MNKYLCILNTMTLEELKEEKEVLKDINWIEDFGWELELVEKLISLRTQQILWHTTTY